ncbi:hypothetical protein LY28_02214 [Ruminiclostridium sufflavum DSM 19573]|uniref:DUF4129 domain-containing protein n=1 Tax=Ruminiclostridium sufflavum DSM 19573 TaxID=1121337 RepID=A0A318XJX6_9FIRM|nr:hypothetical protein [Ruminiclostridium sufflavum]PYG87309.1 hypothetical protein LY28_02214 [Ruminiclostridium sufflavum DSM 19573]
MAGLFLVTCMMECFALVPIGFVVFQFFLPGGSAFILSLALCGVSAAAYCLCRFRLKTYIYRIISVLASAAIAYLAAGSESILLKIVFVICLYIFLNARREMNPDKSLAVQTAAAALLFNILLAFIASKGIAGISELYSNAAVLISTVSAVILLILKQTDDSRRFGKNNMRIGSTQRRNNRTFAIASLLLLFGVSAVGQVQNIYRFAISIIAGLINGLGYLLGIIGFKETQKSIQPDLQANVESAEPSMLQRIIEAVVKVLIIAALLSLAILTVYFFIRSVIKLIIRITNWLRNGERITDRSYEDGHIDEKQSLYRRNLINMARKVSKRAAGLFSREIPYNRLPNGIEKTRRLFRHYRDKAALAGVHMTKAATAEEICRSVSDIAPETKEFNTLMAKCYSAARYGETAPAAQELSRLEEDLLR